MNWLAHFYLAGPDPHARVGAMLGDFHRGPVETLADARWRAAVREHRAIDVWTDAHPLVCASRARLPAPLRRYGGIILDVAYDHCLARDWANWSAQSLPAFVGAVHAALRADYDRLPPRMQRSIDHLLQGRTLLSYREPAGVARALAGIATRLSRPSPLAAAGPAVTALLPDWAGDFAVFFPELVAFVANRTDAGL